MAAGRSLCCHFRLIWQQGLVTSKTVENDGTANRRDTNAVKNRHYWPLFSIFPANSWIGWCDFSHHFFFRTVEWCEYSYHFGETSVRCQIMRNSVPFPYYPERCGAETVPLNKTDIIAEITMVLAERSFYERNRTYPSTAQIGGSAGA